MRRTHLPIAEPCHESWNAMDPVARGRFCKQCDKQVFDLSSMTEREAERVLEEHAGNRVCVRYHHTADGEIRFRPERAAMAVAGLAIALAACTPHGLVSMGEPAPRPTPSRAVDDDIMGKIEVPPRPAPTPAPTPAPEPTPPEPTTAVMGDFEAPVPQPPPASTDPDAPCDRPVTPTSGVRSPPGLQRL